MGVANFHHHQWTEHLPSGRCGVYSNFNWFSAGSPGWNQVQQPSTVAALQRDGRRALQQNWFCITVTVTTLRLKLSKNLTLHLLHFQTHNALLSHETWGCLWVKTLSYVTSATDTEILPYSCIMGIFTMKL